MMHGSLTSVGVERKTSQSIRVSLVVAVMWMRCAVVFMYAAILAGCAPKGTCSAPGIATTEHLHPLRGALLACLSNPEIELVAANKRGLWWVDRDRILWLVPRDGGTPLVVATIDRGVWHGDIAIDDDAVYVPTQNGIKRAKWNALGLWQDAATNQRHVRVIAVDDTHLFWIAESLSDGPYAIFRQSKQGGSVDVVVDQERFSGPLTLDDQNIYWSTSSVRRREPTDFIRGIPAPIRSRVVVPSRLMTVSKAGGAARILGEAKSKWLTDRPEVKWLDDPWEEIDHIATDVMHVYWATTRPFEDEATIWRTSKADGTTIELANFEDVRSLALTKSSVYVDTPKGLFRIGKTGGPPVKSLATECLATVVGSDGVYCATSYLTLTGDVRARIELIREE